VSFTVEPNPGATRGGTITAAGQTVQITQDGCSYSIAPGSVTIDAAGGAGSVAVSAGDACAWTAGSNDSWITIASGATGSGAGTVSFSVAANTGAARSGSLTVAGQRFTVNQGAAPVACSFSVTPTSQNAPAAGGAFSVTVTTASGCAWTTGTSGTASWVTVTSGQTGTGNGVVSYTVAANTSTAARSTTFTVAGQAVSVSQAGAACTYDVSPRSFPDFPAGGSDASRSGTIGVTAPGGCAWAAQSGAPWIRITAGLTGNGNGSVAFTVEPNNTGQRRTAAITIQGVTVTIGQSP
jgi:hypothetical protein